MTTHFDVALISVANGFGLSHDISALEKILRAAGLVVGFIDVRHPVEYAAHVNIFIETFSPALKAMAKSQIIIPNPEWWVDDWDGMTGDALILAKTVDALAIFRGIVQRTTYTGFMPRKRRIASVKRTRSFLHIAGQSHGRMTDAIIRIWRHDGRLPHLTVTATYERSRRIAHNLTVVGGWIDDRRLRRLQNESIFHVCSSRYEGFGHTQWEAFDCGAACLIPAQPPMGEALKRGRAIPIEASVTSERMGRANMVKITELALLEAVTAALALDVISIRPIGINARGASEWMRRIAKKRIVNTVLDECRRSVAV